MLTNYHTHTTFCDGKNTPEEIVRYAIDSGFSAIGFSGHGNTPFDLRYCMKDTDAYISSITKLKEKYKNKIQIYLGAEEDAFAPVNRSDFDYLIGSSHYFCIKDKFYPIDSTYEHFKKCLDVFNGDVIRLAETYYEVFCNYISKREPNIIGHFDLITKFEEIDEQRFFNNSQYLSLATKYICEAIKHDVIFEVNTGAISRGFRKTPYPHTDLLKILKKYDGKVILSSDSHSVDTLDYEFKETRKLLRDIGFDCVYVLYDNVFKKDLI